MLSTLAACAPAGRDPAAGPAPQRVAVDADVADSVDNVRTRQSAAAPAPTPEYGRTRPAAPPIRTTVVGFTDDLDVPESARYDAAERRWYVSNIAGQTQEKNGRGYISRLADDGAPGERRWIAGGRGGVTLNAPKGLALAGDTLWVADIDAVRGFDRRTGRPVAMVDLAPLGAVFLNAIAIGPDSALYVTDTDMRPGARGMLEKAGDGRVYRIGRDGVATVALAHRRLANPNGIVWDARRTRFVIVPKGGDTIVTWRVGATTPEPLVTGPGLYDGVLVSPQGQLLVSSQASDAVHALVGNRLVLIIPNLPGVADIGLDSRGRLAVPQLSAGRVTLFELPAIPVSGTP